MKQRNTCESCGTRHRKGIECPGRPNLSGHPLEFEVKTSVVANQAAAMRMDSTPTEDGYGHGV
jgi:hypothetical protein